jgi:hypothetical protein
MFRQPIALSEGALSLSFEPIALSEGTLSLSFEPIALRI